MLARQQYVTKISSIMTNFNTEEFTNLPTFPLPWRPSERSKMMTQFFMDNVEHDDVREYMRSIQDTYVITGLGVRAVSMGVGYFSVGANVFGNSYKTDRDPTDIQREFEAEILGLPPAPTSDGLYFHEHPAGFGDGKYPIEPFAELANTDADTLQRILDDRETTKHFGHVIIRASNLIVPVKNYPNQRGIVLADNVTELSEQGVALLETSLAICDYSTKNKFKCESAEWSSSRKG